MVRRGWSLWWVALAVGAPALGCGETSDETEPLVEPAPTACAVGELTRENGSCLPAGASGKPCAPGETDDFFGECVPAGIVFCAPGFEAAPDGGCRAILPSTPCVAGQMAIPGETSCHPVGDCGTGIWGNVDTSGDVEYVDASFQGVSDGSSTAPWVTINQAVNAAAVGATVAVAAGSYAEDVSIVETLTLWGRCPDMVEIVGQGAVAAVYLQGQADGASVRGLAVTGPEIGVLVAKISPQVSLRELWVHDNGFRSVDIENANVVLSDSLVEGGVEEGVFQIGNNVTVERCVIRNTQPDFSLRYGRGIGAQAGTTVAKLTVTDSLIEGNHEVGIGAFGAIAVVERTLVRDQQWMVSDGTAGWGLWINHDGIAMKRADATVRDSVVEANYEAGVVVVGSDALLENTTVRASKVLPNDPYSGIGVISRNKFTFGERALVTLTNSLVTDNSSIGLYVLGADAVVNASVIRATQPAPTSPPVGGRGIDAEADPLSNQISTVAVTGSVIEDNVDTGIFGAASDLVIGTTLIRNIAPASDGRFGRGINVQLDTEMAQFPTTAWVTDSLIEDTHEAAIAVLSASATVQRTTIRGVDPRPSDGWMGRGVMIQQGPGTDMRSAAWLQGVLVEDTFDSGVFVSGGEAAIHDCVVKGTAIRQEDGLFGDAISGVLGPTTTYVEVLHSLVEGNARAGISGFSADMRIGFNQLECNGFDLAYQALGPSGGLQDVGGNLCGCGEEAHDCQLSSAMLEAPSPLE